MYGLDTVHIREWLFIEILGNKMEGKKMRIKIITDSLSDIPKSLIQDYNIEVLPLTIIFGDMGYKDNVDISVPEFYKRLETGEQPKSSQVNPNEFIEAIDKSFADGYDHIIIIDGSGKVSGTYQSANIAASEHSRSGDISVFDSKALSYGCGMIVVKAAKMAKEGDNLDAILCEVSRMIEGNMQIFSVDTLEYLHRNGRLSTSKMVLGSLLNLKPILGIIDGVVEPIKKARGKKKLSRELIKTCKEYGLKEGQSIGLGHGMNLEDFEELKEIVAREFEPAEVVETYVGCTIGTHTGPGTLAVFFTKQI